HPALQREANYSKLLHHFASLWAKLFGPFSEKQNRGTGCRLCIYKKVGNGARSALAHALAKATLN
ncbi:hypothetical protein, partial [Undibacterium sp. TS12]|uniref:hypothetical protein n=1 Tax=Undibacterium sp. TS12 TaxID=2908202 RepID=UPI001F4CD96B